MTHPVVFIIGQIASGKTTIGDQVAQQLGASLISIDALRNDGLNDSTDSITRLLTTAALERPVMFESTGAREDFEQLLQRVEFEIGRPPIVVKFLCSLETANQRLRTADPYRPPRFGGGWERQLRWTAMRLRHVAADETLFTDELSRDEVSDVLIQALTRRFTGQGDNGVQPVGAFTFSQLSTFAHCPLEYQFRHVEGGHSLYESVPQFVGRIVHASLAWFHSQEHVGRRPPLEDLIGQARRTVNEEVIEHGTVLDRAVGTAIELLQSYYWRLLPSDQLRTVAVEKSFQVDLGGGLSLRGTIDRVATTSSGRTIVIDYKTSNPERRERSLIPDLVQLDAYGVAVLLLSDADTVTAQRIQIANSEIEHHEVRKGAIPAITGGLRRWIRMTTGSTFPARPSTDCRWCAFNSVCPTPLIPQAPGIEHKPRCDPQKLDPTDIPRN